MEEEYIMFVYKTTNLITNLIYIGQHIYKKEIKNPKYYLGSGTLLLESIKDYGRQNHEREILEYCDNFKQLNEREIYWIDKYDSINPEIGMNISAGGSQCLPSERYKLSMTSPERLKKFYETRKKNEHKYKYHTEEYKKWCSENMKGENNPNYGNKWSDELKKKVSEYRKNNKIFKGKNNPNYGNNWSDEQKEHLSNYRKKNGIAKGKNNPNYGKYGKEASGYLEIEQKIKDIIIHEYKHCFESIRSLSKKYTDVSEYKIREILIEEKLEIKLMYMSKENEEKIIEMYCNQKLSVNKISKYFKIDGRNIKKVLNNNNIKIKSRGGDKYTKTSKEFLSNIQIYIDKNSIKTKTELVYIFDISFETLSKYIKLGEIKLYK